MSGVAGSNIADAVAGGIQYPGGGAVAPTVPAFQPPIGGSVLNDETPGADTNYVGVNANTAYSSNVLAEDFAAGFEAAVATTQGTGAWVQAGAAIAFDGEVSIVAGVASPDASTGTHVCKVTDGVASGEFFWALEL
jgi:hypothetical protein